MENQVFVLLSFQTLGSCTRMKSACRPSPISSSVCCATCFLPTLCCRNRCSPCSLERLGVSNISLAACLLWDCCWCSVITKIGWWIFVLHCTQYTLFCYWQHVCHYSCCTVGLDAGKPFHWFCRCCILHGLWLDGPWHSTCMLLDSCRVPCCVQTCSSWCIVSWGRHQSTLSPWLSLLQCISLSA